MSNMKRKKPKGVCNVCLTRDIHIDINHRCTHCAYKFSQADMRACDIGGIRRDMSDMGIPVTGFASYKEKKLYDLWDSDVED